jgi:hypothetical protein
MVGGVSSGILKNRGFLCVSRLPNALNPGLSREGVATWLLNASPVTAGGTAGVLGLGCPKGDSAPCLRRLEGPLEDGGEVEFCGAPPELDKLFLHPIADESQSSWFFVSVPKTGICVVVSVVGLGASGKKSVEQPPPSSVVLMVNPNGE